MYSDKFFSRAPVILISIFVAGVCWFLSTGLSGDLWWLAWIAPLSILFIITEVSATTAFLVAFSAYLIGRLSWVNYLRSVLPLILVVVFTLILPLIFALILVATRKVILRTNHWIAFLCFPILYTAFEWIYFEISKDGTAGSLAYSQSNCLPLIQIASITGVTGITFFVCFVPALLAAAIYFRRSPKISKIPIWLLIITVPSVFLFGFIRLHIRNDSPQVKIGMIVIDESFRRESPDSILRQYANSIEQVARDNVQLILLPEKIAIIKNDEQLKIFEDLAKKYHVDILAGITKENENERLNQAVLISPDKPLQVYSKVNLYEGEHFEGIRSGNLVGDASWKNEPVGLVVCKDMDFDRFIRQYKKANALFVPAWDFVRDDWLHSRMAIMRGIENGFSVARNARQGTLTITDFTGKVLDEVYSSDGKAHIMIGQLPLHRTFTLYSKVGNVFGFLNLLAACWILVLLWRKKAV
jgi:apolipoprotein N-acyltransferase